MKVFFTFLISCFSLVNVSGRESTIAEAEKNPATTVSLVLHGTNNDASRLLKISSGLVSLQEVVIDAVKSDAVAAELVASVAACNTVTQIVFRNCSLNQLPSNLAMLTNVLSFRSEHTEVSDGEQFYNTIAAIPKVENVSITGSDFRNLPASFSRMRIMKNISLVNEDIMLASGYDLNTKLPGELIASDTVHFGFGDDVMNLSYTCYNADACVAHMQMFRDVLQGAFRPSNVFYTPLQTKEFRKSHPLVKPPVANCDVYPDVFSSSTMTGSTFEYGSGTQISIPSMAFQDANGNPVTGSVEITYREFRDPVDIIFSGIPMKYDSAGNSGDFKSAGMFEMNASQNGQEVFLREGKQVDVKFAVTDTSADYNFYRLDEQKGWVYEESPGGVEADSAVMEPQVTATTVSAAVKYYLEKVSKVRLTRGRTDTTSFENRYLDTNYCGDKKMVVSERWRPRQKAKMFSNLYLEKVAGGKGYSCVKIRRVNSWNHCNPELYVYSGYSWQLDGVSSRNLRKKYGKRSGISDMRVIDEGGEYYLEFKYPWGFERIKATPVRLDRDDKPQEVKDMVKNRMFRSYTKQLNSRARRTNRECKNAIRRYTNDRLWATNDSLVIWNKARRFMDSTEMAMPHNEWAVHARKQQAEVWVDLDSGMRATSAIYQALAIEGMGIYNCDQVMRTNAPVTVGVSKIKTALAAVVPVMIYVVSKTANMVMSYFTGNRGVDITYGRNDVNTLVAIDKDGAVYVISEEEFANKTPEERGVYSVEGELVSGDFTTPEVVRRAVFSERYE